MNKNLSSRRDVLKAIGLGATALAIPGCFQADMSTSKKQKPNIVLINVDDMGYGDLGCYGSKLSRTPRLDRMAKDGVKFTSFYVGSPMCTPSRAALMTGCYPQRVGFSRLQNPIGHVYLAGEATGLHPDEITIADMLKNAGYKTKMVGKWHLGDQPEFMPNRQGFDSFFGLPYSHDIESGNPNNEKWNLPPLPLLRDENVIESQPDCRELNKKFTNEVVKYISENKNDPFFIYFAHILPHVPFVAPNEFVERLTPDETTQYRACIEYIDYSIGQILDALRKAGIYDNTLVIFTSDHGSAAQAEYWRKQGHSNGQLRGGKGETWEGGMRVPAIFRWPNTIQAGNICNELVTTMDMFPTLADIAGGELPTDRMIDGKSIVNLLKGESGARTPHEEFYYFWMDEFHAVRSGPWKLIVKEPYKPHFKNPLLFNLDDDIGETKNIAAEHPKVVERLLALAQKARQDLGDKSMNIIGKNCRPLGRVENPKTLLPRIKPEI